MKDITEKLAGRLIKLQRPLVSILVSQCQIIRDAKGKRTIIKTKHLYHHDQMKTDHIFNSIGEALASFRYLGGIEHEYCPEETNSDKI